MYNESEFSEPKNVQVPIIRSQNDMFDIFLTFNIRWIQISFYIDKLLYYIHYFSKNQNFLKF